jgi:hypothetical protein
MEVYFHALLGSALDRGELHAAAALTPKKLTQYVLDRKLSGPQSQSVCCGL